MDELYKIDKRHNETVHNIHKQDKQYSHEPDYSSCSGETCEIDDKPTDIDDSSALLKVGGKSGTLIAI